MSQALTQTQLDSLIIIERVSAALSLTGTALVITTFLGSKPFRTLSNTLIFYSSFGNVLSNVAHLVAIAGVTAGPNSALCQTQGFLQQMFMPADSLWSLAMAGNVYLAFFHHYDSGSLKRLHWKYFLICYGIPFIPALIYLFVKNAEGQRIYGGATLWCWIANEWAPLRIAIFYGPVWFIMLFIFGIYIRVGYEIYKKRKDLQTIYQTSISEHHGTQSQVAISAPYSELVTNEPIRGIKTTEVHVTSNTRATELIFGKRVGSNGSTSDEMSKSDRYSVTVTTNQFNPFTHRKVAPPTQEKEKKKKQHASLDKVMVAYAKCAALFAASLLITWTPSSANRVYGLIHPTKVSYALSAASACVLPLQGFWNAVIYFVTSCAACRTLWATADSRLRAVVGGPNRFLGAGKRESDSMVELSAEVSSRSSDVKEAC